MWDALSWVADLLPPTYSGVIAIVVGAILLIYSFFQSNKQVLKLVAPHESSLMETLDRHHMRGRGFKLVAIGGGTGLSNMLKGLKAYTSNITAVVTVADDGGSSGRLRESMDMVPPGDIRNCIAALAQDDEVITQLFQYRFDDDAPEDLRKHSFGNLFLTALTQLGETNSMANAVKHACHILKARGMVLPISNEPMHLVAEMEDGQVVQGESQISEAGGRIKRIGCQKPVPKILPEVLEAVAAADLIVLGPGSLYTSIIPNLLVPELARAIARSQATKIYVCNVMTQPGETDSYTVADHIEAILEHAEFTALEHSKSQRMKEELSATSSVLNKTDVETEIEQEVKVETKLSKEIKENLIDYVIVNSAPPKKHQRDRYKELGQYPVEIDYHRLKKMDIEIFPTNLLQRGDLVRHNHRKLAKAIMQIFSKDLSRHS